jgi:hypothetical protein
MNVSPTNQSAAVEAVFPRTKLGRTIKGKRLVIVAESNSLKGANVWIDAVPMFNADQTAIYIEYQLVVERTRDQIRRATISPGVVERALATKADPIHAATFDQFAWLCKNCPEFDEAIAPFALEESTARPTKTSARKRL